MIPRHHQAPPVVDGVSPFTTPGTRITWGSGDEWLAGFDAINRRGWTSKRYADLAAHLDELARHPDFIAAQPLEDLRAMRAVVLKHYRPVAGQRAGTSYERVINEINNAIGILARVLIVAADADRRPRRVLRDLVAFADGALEERI
jgi:hypothetical protein